jgi:hypothetical protein
MASCQYTNRVITKAKTSNGSKYAHNIKLYRVLHKEKESKRFIIIKKKIEGRVASLYIKSKVALNQIY